MNTLPEIVILNLSDEVRAFARHPKIQDKNYGFTSNVVDNLIHCMNDKKTAGYEIERYCREIGYRAGSRGEQWVSLYDQVFWLAGKIQNHLLFLCLYGDNGKLLYEPRDMDEFTLPDEVTMTRRGDD